MALYISSEIGIGTLYQSKVLLFLPFKLGSKLLVINPAFLCLYLLLSLDHLCNLLFLPLQIWAVHGYSWTLWPTVRYFIFEGGRVLYAFFLCFFYWAARSDRALQFWLLVACLWEVRMPIFLIIDSVDKFVPIFILFCECAASGLELLQFSDIVFLHLVDRRFNFIFQKIMSLSYLRDGIILD